MGGQFHSNGGEQNIAQGDHAIGKQENNHGPVIKTTGNQAPAVNAQGDVTITYGVPFEKYEQVRDECERIKLEYGIRDAAFASFFRILNQENIPCAEWGAKLPEIAFRYKELLLRFEAVTSDDPQVQALKEQAKQAIENGEYDRADALLNQAKERDRAAVATLKASLAEQQAALEKRQLSEAQSCVDQARLQRLQYRYEKSAQYWQEAAAALPEGHKAESALFLHSAGYDLYRIAKYKQALVLFEQSLVIFREIGDKKNAGITLNNIGSINSAQGDKAKALQYYEQSLHIMQEIGDKKGEGASLNNISQIYAAQYNYVTAMKYLEQSLRITQEIGDKAVERVTLGNTGKIHYAKGDYDKAMLLFEQSLCIGKEIDDKADESAMLNNISQIYAARNDYAKAMKYLEQSLRITQDVGNKAVEGATLNNISKIYKEQGEYATAMKYLEQSISILQEIGDNEGEARAYWNIGLLHIKQGELAKAEQYLSRAVQLEEQLEHPDLKKDRKVLEAVRATLRGQGTANAASTVKLP